MGEAIVYHSCCKNWFLVNYLIFEELFLTEISTLHRFGSSLKVCGEPLIRGERDL